ncbi:LysR substrate-binding domain-containing protein [Microvirga massiliensis]|uniref:LysR substrate-binding domain-containing protein n=1 Tax=Microvirga massiliensis TaxID=1033741 RepID=UPI00244E95CC|nr:LysR substrate-binding domain-containing protein [Microvirga massiliensis]
MENLAHSASLHSGDRIAPLKPGTKHLVDRIFGSRALRPRIAYEASNTTAIMGLVAAGLGVTLYPEGLRRFKPDHVVMREIEDCGAQIETLVAWERNAPAKRVLHFVEACRRLQEQANTLVNV